MTSSPPPHEPLDASAVETVRHEEQLRVSVQRYPTERIRVQKVIVEEERTITVAVRREELRVTREPLPMDAPGPDQPQPAEIVIVLHEEHPVVTLHTRPVERVRIARHIETEQRTLSETVGREHVEITHDAPSSAGSPAASP